MPFLSRFKEKIQSLAAAIKTAFLGIFFKIAEKTAGLRIRIQVFVDGLMEKQPNKKRFVIMVAAGVCGVLLIIAGMTFFIKGRSSEQRIPAGGTGTSSGTGAAQRVIIPPDELFLPEEPDFIPGVMLERERRAVWTAEDAAPLWQDPLKNGEQEWRDRIEKTVDEILESVP